MTDLFYDDGGDEAKPVSTVIFTSDGIVLKLENRERVMLPFRRPE